MPYWRLHYHLVWATRDRAPLITPDVELVVHQTVFGKARQLGLVLHAVGGVADHVHLVVSIPPTRSVAEIVKQLKGASSRAVHLRTNGQSRFRWQEGYGALTLSENSLAPIVEYVRRQAEHHASGTIVATCESMGDMSQ